MTCKSQLLLLATNTRALVDIASRCEDIRSLKLWQMAAPPISSSCQRETAPNYNEDDLHAHAFLILSSALRSNDVAASEDWATCDTFDIVYQPQ
jgi:hypothetical protein